MKKNSGGTTRCLFPFVCLFLTLLFVAIPVTTNVAAAANEPPNKPNLSAPANGATVSLTPQLQTGPFEDPDAGDVHAQTRWQINNESDEPVFDEKSDTELISLAVPAGTLTAGITYTWRVKFYDDDGNVSVWSRARSFIASGTVGEDHTPNKPNLSAPAGGATVSLTPVLQTDPFEDPDAGDVHAQTRWQISNESDGVVFNKNTDTELVSLTVPQGKLKADAVYTWKVRFFDNNGTASPWSRARSFTVSGTGQNEVPSASFTADPSEGELPLIVSFNASASTDPDGQIVSYAWNFGDGSMGSGVTTSHQYTAEGSFSVLLTVTDDAEATHTATRTITVTAPSENEFPAADFTADPATGLPPLMVSFDASGSSDPDGQIVSYDWDFGDGASGSGVTVSHEYTAAGSFTASLLVTDNDGAENTVTVAITVTDDTNERPSRPRLFFPADGQIVSVTPELIAGFFTDPDPGDTHDKTRWKVVDENDTIILDIRSTSRLLSLIVPEYILQPDTTYYWKVRYCDNQGTWSRWSETWSFKTEFLGDDVSPQNGIPDDQEVDASVDLDDDGTPDINQPNMMAIEAVGGKGQLGLNAGTNVVSLETFRSIVPEDVDGFPLDIDMPLGLVSFKCIAAEPGARVTVTIYFSEKMDKNVRWLKYDFIDGLVDYADHARFSADGYSVTLELKDGGYGDFDRTVNGIIIDPSGVGTTSTDEASSQDTNEDAAGAEKNSSEGGGCFIGTALSPLFGN
jgi:PKD repeat protein